MDKKDGTLNLTHHVNGVNLFIAIKHFCRNSHCRQENIDQRLRNT